MQVQFILRREAWVGNMPEPGYVVQTVRRAEPVWLFEDELEGDLPVETPASWEARMRAKADRIFFGGG